MIVAKLTIALQRYDLRISFFMGAVGRPWGLGWTLKAVEVGIVPLRRGGIDQLARYIQDSEVDKSETSVSLYLQAEIEALPP